MGYVYEMIIILIGAYIALFLLIFKLFVGNIILFDSFCTSFIVGYYAHLFGHWHTAICLLTGVICFFVLSALQITKYGFWIIGILFSLFWAELFGEIALSLSNNDKIWYYVIFGISFFFVIGLHLYARDDLVI